MSGLQHILPYKLPSVSELIYVKTNIAGYFFDAFLEINHTHQSRITSHPVQTGANITDHIYVEPVELNMKIKMSDCMQSLVGGQFTANYTRSVSAYNILRELQKSRIPFQVTTRLEIYQNMVIETLVVNDDVKNSSGLEVDVTLKQILVVSVKTIKTSARVNATNKLTLGPTNSTPYNKRLTVMENKIRKLI